MVVFQNYFTFFGQIESIYCLAGISIPRLVLVKIVGLNPLLRVCGIQRGTVPFLESVCYHFFSHLDVEFAGH